MDSNDRDTILIRATAQLVANTPLDAVMWVRFIEHAKAPPARRCPGPLHAPRGA